MIVKMDPEAIRAMAAKFRATADSMESHMASITQSVTQAGWQSQAREEFIMQLAMLQSTTTQTVSALRMMAQAADQKAAQWEAIASVFNGPFHFLSGIWQQVTGFVGGLWSSLTKGIANLNWPSLPAWVLPGIGLGGAFPGLLPDWDFKKPDWWPFEKGEQSSGGADGSGSQGGSWGGESSGGEQKKESEPSVGTQPTETVPDPVEAPPKPYPQPPNSPKLREVTGKASSYTCATYARARRSDLGSTQSNNEPWDDGAAANYIGKFEDTAFQLPDGETSLKDSVAPGYAVVWEPTHPNANKKYGHVAIVEAVYGDHVVISEASKVNGVYTIRERSIPIEQFFDDGVWLIP